MNLLVTNTRAAQAYVIIRALRPLAARIVVTMYGKNALAARLLSHAANSRLVDRRYHVPSPAGDWASGRLEKTNSPREDAYVDSLLKICERERIDSIFPSWDAQIYVLAKNKERFEKLGVLIPIPDYETLITPLDKYRTILAAQDAGLPSPRTYLPDGLADLGRIAGELGFPAVLKPRYTSWGTEIVHDRESLAEKTRGLAAQYSMPMVQEYIPGTERQDIHLLLDRHGEAKLVFSRGTHRTLRLDPHAHFSTVHRSTSPHPYAPQAIRFLRKLRWWGSATVETLVDARDGQAKFMELIPRFRRQLWNTVELGINEPWMCLQIARGEAVEPIRDYPVGVAFLSPMEDALVLGFQVLDLIAYKLRTGVTGKAPLDRSNAPPGVKDLFESLADAYVGPHPKRVDPYFRYFFQDPVVSVLWWSQLASWMMGLAGRLGR